MAPNDLRERGGKFLVKNSNFRTKDFIECFALLKFFPVRTEYYLYEYGIWMEGYSPLFEKVEEGCTIPEYTIYFIRDVKDGNRVCVRVDKEGKTIAFRSRELSRGEGWEH